MIVESVIRAAAISGEATMRGHGRVLVKLKSFTL